MNLMNKNIFKIVLTIAFIMKKDPYLTIFDKF
jgi:hypothetical protein